MARQRLRVPDGTSIALVLQGGGALGAYQAGVFDELSQTRLEPNWIAGISIGALNACVIAGNKPKDRIEKLQEFWQRISAPNWLPPTTFGLQAGWEPRDPAARSWLDSLEAWRALIEGQRGFYTPRNWLAFGGMVGAEDPAKVSWYDTGPMLETLNSMCDFKRVNQGDLRVSVGAVNVATGQLEYFDNRRQELRAEHFLASGALPPSFPAVEIDGNYYWDGGVVSNTPLSYVMEQCTAPQRLILQVDLWNAEGALPETLLDVSERTKEVQYASRTRQVTQMHRIQQHYHRVIRELLERLPKDHSSDDPWVRHARAMSTTSKTSLVHLTYRDMALIGHFKDYQFGRIAIHDHMEAGRRDMRQALANPQWFEMPSGHDTFNVHSVDPSVIKDQETN